ncbi:hypothetical protein, partial [Adlercreutzia equolifaciens]|uniref:hypothetical protein n=1 Tax=Adlercreutzia equolifaciens TaxID=446660 RepID=UPI003AB55D95
MEKAGLATDWDFWKMWGMFSGNNFELLDIRFPEDGLISSKEELGKDFPPFERQKAQLGSGVDRGWGCGQKLGPRRVRKGVRMYDRDTIELALLALEEGMSQGE